MNEVEVLSTEAVAQYQDNVYTESVTLSTNKCEKVDVFDGQIHVSDDDIGSQMCATLGGKAKTCTTLDGGPESIEKSETLPGDWSYRVSGRVVEADGESKVRVRSSGVVFVVDTENCSSEELEEGSTAAFEISRLDLLDVDR